ncbi:MAG: hypothetical protein EOP54_03440 [Sphingobacteriales bacterium]|nr:MAG: hypothetical protein EOP54_03440 [Sphingobacteriales bacterium]
MKHKIIAAILLPLVTFFSCTKESVKTKENKDIKRITLASNVQNWSAAANSSNPYDYVGLEHNKAAQHLVENLSYGNLPNPQVNYNTVKTYVAANFNSTTAANFNANTSAALLSNILSNFGSTLPTANNYAPVININTNLSAIAKGHITGLINQLLNPSNSALDYNFYKSMIMNWENNISSVNVSQDDKKSMYMFASVIRYSLLLWKDVEYPDSSNGQLQLMKFKIRLFGWIATAVVDGAVAVGAAGLVTPLGSAALAAGASGAVAAVCGIYNW